MASIFEAIMVICFGLSWPISVYKSWKSRTAKGKSLFFELFILIGYLFGMAGKILTGNLNYVFAFYILNTAMISVDIILFLRNRKLDQSVKA